LTSEQENNIPTKAGIIKSVKIAFFIFYFFIYNYHS